MESYVIARPTGQIENGMQNTVTKKAYLNFEEFFSIVDCGYIMHTCISV